MALSTLTMTRANFMREVAVLMGWSRTPSSWNNTQLQDYADIEERALRQFYWPAQSGEDAPVYEWSFLRKEGTITLVTADWDYNLPDDFSGTILDDSTSYAASVDQPKLRKVSESELRQLRARDPQTGYPLYYAIRPKAHSYTAGLNWELLVYPTPTSVEANAVITYRYIFNPDTIDNTNLYPVGGARFDNLLLASYLSAAEWFLDDDPNGPFTQKFQEQLAGAIRQDKQVKENDRGGQS